MRCEYKIVAGGLGLTLLVTLAFGPHDLHALEAQYQQEPQLQGTLASSTVYTPTARVVLPQSGAANLTGEAFRLKF